MKKFIFKTIGFVAPFMLSYLAFVYWGELNKGDLLRIGSLADDTGDYLEIWSEDFSQDIYYSRLSALDKQTSFDIFTIGDSFSQQEAYGYQNYLVRDEKVSVLHYDQSTNAIHTLNQLINGDFFDKVEVKYVVLETVERNFANEAVGVDPASGITFDELKANFKAFPYEEQSPRFFSPSTIRFPLHHALYPFDDNAYVSQVYKAKVNADLFSTGDKELLFYYGDLTNLPYNSKKESVEILNNELSALNQKLAAKGIKLIVLPAPDKYSVYYDYIADKASYPEPQFFNELNALEKDYLYIDSKAILDEALKGEKDIYFYDNTHWSPIGSKLIARQVKEAMTQ